MRLLLKLEYHNRLVVQERLPVIQKEDTYILRLEGKKDMKFNRVRVLSEDGEVLGSQEIEDRIWMRAGDILQVTYE